MIQIEREKLEKVLESLENNKKNHHYCEDTWYSCPKHEEGCANEAEGDECNCGADEINAQFDEAITIIKDVLAQPDQFRDATKMMAQKDSEPRGWQWFDTGIFRKKLPDTADPKDWKPLYTKEQL